MSTATSRRVWEESRQSGSALLILLSMADRSDDDGYCWPGMEDIAQRARINKRHAQRLVNAIEADGELYTERSSGRGRTSQYIVTTGQSQNQIANTLTRRFEMDAALAVTIAAQIVQLQANGKGDIHAQKVTPTPPFNCEKVTSTPPFSQNGKGDIHAQKVTPTPPFNREKVTSTRGKGDAQTTPNIKEPMFVCLFVDPTLPIQEILNKQTNKQEAAYKFLTDPEIGVADLIAADLAAGYQLEDIQQQAVAWLRDLSAGRVTSAGALITRIRRGFQARAITDEDRQTALWRRHWPEDRPANRYTDNEYADLIIR